MPVNKYKDSVLIFSGLRASLAISLLLFVTWAVSLALIERKNVLSNELTSVSQQPFLASGHVALSRLYAENTNFESARAEISIIQFLNPDVLGESDAYNLNSRLMEMPQKTAATLTFWKERVNQYPEYSSGIIQQIYLYYNSGDFESAKLHANTLKFLDRRAFDSLPPLLKNE